MNRCVVLVALVFLCCGCNEGFQGSRGDGTSDSSVSGADARAGVSTFQVSDLEEVTLPLEILWVVDSAKGAIAYMNTIKGVFDRQNYNTAASQKGLEIRSWSAIGLPCASDAPPQTTQGPSNKASAKPLAPAYDQGGCLDKTGFVDAHFQNQRVLGVPHPVWQPLFFLRAKDPTFSAFLTSVNGISEEHKMKYTQQYALTDEETRKNFGRIKSFFEISLKIMIYVMGSDDTPALKDVLVDLGDMKKLYAARFGSVDFLKMLVVAKQSMPRMKLVAEGFGGAEYVAPGVGALVSSITSHFQQIKMLKVEKKGEVVSVSADGSALDAQHYGQDEEALLIKKEAISGVQSIELGYE